MKQIISMMCLVLLGACATDATDPETVGTSEALLGSPGGFDAAYVGCDEYAGVGPVFAIDRLRELVPDDYTVVEPFPGAGIVVAQAGSCDDIIVEGRSYGPGIFAQFGVSVFPPASPGAGDFYQLAFATDSPVLAAALRRMGVNARFSPQLVYEISDDDELLIEVPRPSEWAFRIEGPIVRPDPSAPANPTTVFNYWSQGRSQYGNILQENVVEGIRFGQGPDVVLVPEGSEISALTFGSPLSFPFFSAPEVFDRADLMVEANAF